LANDGLRALATASDTCPHRPPAELLLLAERPSRAHCEGCLYPEIPVWHFSARLAAKQDQLAQLPVGPPRNQAVIEGAFPFCGCPLLLARSNYVNAVNSF
jgi:hypothetical protein